ncbi:MAG TPA: GNAT family N-acetyltransferase [Rhabdochlamydiaceae bacterium]|nr:GNAT family N-acetyltransferase [Rhabdochlamydiaceae bacterium]
MKKRKNHEFRFHFQPVDQAHRSLVHHWLKQPHVAQWFYGQGLKNTIKHLDDFLKGSSSGQYWIGFDQERPFAFLITSVVKKPNDELTKWCTKEGAAITLDLLIGETDYLGKGLAHIVVQEFLLSQFPNVAEVLIDPEATNSHAIHIYKKIGFIVLGEFIPSHSPHPHYMMHLDMKKLITNNF